MEHKLEEAIVDGIWRDVQQGHFFTLRVPLSQQLPHSPLFTSLLSSIDGWCLTAPSVDDSQVLWND